MSTGEIPQKVIDKIWGERKDKLERQIREHEKEERASKSRADVYSRSGGPPGDPLYGMREANRHLDKMNKHYLEACRLKPEYDALCKMTPAQKNQMVRDHCEPLRRRYENAKKNATNEGEFSNLARELREMSGYKYADGKDAAELAKECDDLCHKTKERRESRERQEQYERLRTQWTQLCETSKRATSEDEYRTLAEQFGNLCMQFQKMQGYKDTADGANACTARSTACINKYFELKGHREAVERKWRIKAKQCRVIVIAIGAVLGAVVGGFLFVSVHAITSSATPDAIGGFATIAGLVVALIFGIFNVVEYSNIKSKGWSYANADEYDYAGLGCLFGFVMVGIFGLIGAGVTWGLASLFCSSPYGTLRR